MRLPKNLTCDYCYMPITAAERSKLFFDDDYLDYAFHWRCFEMDNLNRFNYAEKRHWWQFWK